MNLADDIKAVADAATPRAHPIKVTPMRAVEAVRTILDYIDPDPMRAGIAETPQRVVKAFGEWFKGYEQDPAKILKVFEDGAEGVDEMVLVGPIPFYSHCEHHMAPFFGEA